MNLCYGCSLSDCRDCPYRARKKRQRPLPVWATVECRGGGTATGRLIAVFSAIVAVGCRALVEDKPGHSVMGKIISLY
jgi:hypothetical protein